MRGGGGIGEKGRDDSWLVILDETEERQRNAFRKGFLGVILLHHLHGNIKRGYLEEAKPNRFTP